MNHASLVLGLDLSTQSLTAVLLDVDTGEKVAELSLNYLRDSRLRNHGQKEPDYVLSPRIPGEADQPAALFLDALDCLLKDLCELADLSRVIAVNTSAQQHGHVYLNDTASKKFSSLRSSHVSQSNLVDHLSSALAYDRAPIWMTACTSEEARFLTRRVGGDESLRQLTGSSAQPRFTGVVIRHVAKRFPEIYRATRKIHLLSSFIPAILSGDCEVPTDFGNACGMNLMNYQTHVWDTTCVSALADGLPGGTHGLISKLPEITAPDEVVGKMSQYFVDKYGFQPECLIVAGSGDNPQSKVLVAGDLLSLGTSLVFMVETDGQKTDLSSAANAMYDGIGRPFMFGCRTNGALVWDQVRLRHGYAVTDFDTAEAEMAAAPLGNALVFWQPRTESFPQSPEFDLWTESGITSGLGAEYVGCIESGLAAVYHYSKGFSPETSNPLFITGNPTKSPGIKRRIAAIWKRPVVSIENTGAALGAAVAGIAAYYRYHHRAINLSEITRNVTKPETRYTPSQEDIDAFHSPGGYLDRFVTFYQKWVDV